MDMLVQWPGWLVGCAVGAGAVIAAGAVACVIEATLDPGGR